ncbi:hypothetical protein KCP77_23195 [Salmonella enterica subsp. enterica]|nr:hypothetical protein KCP77_23195 [Salmonella enterica subsp. enterica]
MSSNIDALFIDYARIVLRHNARAWKMVAQRRSALTTKHARYAGRDPHVVALERYLNAEEILRSDPRRPALGGAL